jgi:hypothetical protein
MWQVKNFEFDFEFFRKEKIDFSEFRWKTRLFEDYEK